MPWRFAFLISMAVLACNYGSENSASSTLSSWTISAEPLLTIGDDDSSAGDDLFAVRGATRLSDGRIVVANGGASEVKFFSTSGDLLATAGREGEGPDEFRGISSFAPARGDTTIVLSRGLAVVAVSPSGSVVRKTQLSRGVLRFPCRMVESSVSVVISGDGNLVIQAEENRGAPGCPPLSDGRSRTTDMLALLTPTDLRVDTLGVFPGTERDGPGYAAFGRALAVAVSSDRIFAGDTGGDSIAVYSLDGSRDTTWHVSLEARPIPEAIRTPQPESRQLRDGTAATPRAYPFTFDPYYPRFARLLADRLGYLWVMSYPSLEELVEAFRLKSVTSAVVDPKGARWLVVDSSGREVASVHTPPGLFVLEVGADYVLGLARSEFDVEIVRLYGLTRS